MKNPNEIIDFTKYLNFPACKESGLYCTKHRIEVEKLLEEMGQY